MRLGADTDAPRGSITVTDTPQSAGDAGVGAHGRPAGSRGGTALMVLMVVAAILPIAVAAARAVDRRWLAVADNGYFLLRARDVLTEHHPLLGTWTSASFSIGIDVNNPGPLLFDALALPAKLGDDAGLAVGVALLNAVSIVGLAVVARRQAGMRGVVVAMAAATALGWALGSELLFDPWQPHSLLFPVFCFLALTWGLACGDLPLLPWAVAVGTLIVQSHVGYVLVVPVLGAWGLTVAGVRVWRTRRENMPEWPRLRRRVRRSLLGAGGVGALLWAQPVYEQLFDREAGGNLGRLLSGIGVSQDTIGLARAPRYVADILALPPWWGRPSSREAFAADLLVPSVEQSIASLPHLTTSIVGLAMVIGVLLASLLRARRGGDSSGTWAAATGLAIVGVAVAALAMTPIGITGIAPHHLRWLWPGGVFVAFAVALPLLSAARTDRGKRLGLAAAALVTVTLSLLNLPTMDATVGPQRSVAALPAIRELLPQLASLRDEHGVLLDTDGLYFAEPYTAPVMAELQRLGVAWFVDGPVTERQVGSSRAHHGQASVRVYLREGDAARDVPPGARRIAFAEGSDGPAVAVFAEPLGGKG